MEDGGAATGWKSGIFNSPLGPTSSPEKRFKKLNNRWAVCKNEARDSSLFWGVVGVAAAVLVGGGGAARVVALCVVVVVEEEELVVVVGSGQDGGREEVGVDAEVEEGVLGLLMERTACASGDA